MRTGSDVTEEILEVLKNKLGSSLEEYLFPPPVFSTMQGCFIGLDLNEGVLVTEFPVLECYLNPYHTLQGGIIAAAIDNTLGPLSVLVAPPNVTRHLELTYSHPVDLQTGRILVTGKFRRQDGKRLFFTADVRDPPGRRLARAKAVHYIVAQGGGEVVPGPTPSEEFS